MRISDNRYSRDRLRLDLALRFIRHQARTHTIRTWTGLTDDRIRKLYRSYVDRQASGIGRPRGKSPQQAAFFTRSLQLQEEATLLASLCCLLGVLPQAERSAGAAHPDPGALPGVVRGELLCQAFEGYLALVPQPRISFEHTVFLVTALARGEELMVRRCGECGALMVVDRMDLSAGWCNDCAAGESASVG